MRIVVAGGSGFLGSALTAALKADGHTVTLLTRSARPSDAGAVTWSPDGRVGPWANALEGADAVVNLSGESIGDGRWTEARKERLVQSRLQATERLVEAILTRTRKPAVLVSGSAVGYYGFRDAEELTEAASPGSDFLARLCVNWESAAMRAAGVTRVVMVRTGLVLDRNGGVLPKIAMPVKLFVGGPVGSGNQYMPWIHLADWVGLVRWALGAEVSGPVNASAPAPVTNRDFMRALGHALHRPSVLPAPAFALRVLLGEMAEALLLNGQRAVPAKARANGYRFKFEQVSDALRAIYA